MDIQALQADFNGFYQANRGAMDVYVARRMTGFWMDYIRNYYAIDVSADRNAVAPSGKISVARLFREGVRDIDTDSKRHPGQPALDAFEADFFGYVFKTVQDSFKPSAHDPLKFIGIAGVKSDYGFCDQKLIDMLEKHGLSQHAVPYKTSTMFAVYPDMIRYEDTHANERDSDFISLFLASRQPAAPAVASLAMTLNHGE